MKLMHAALWLAPLLLLSSTASGGQLAPPAAGAVPGLPMPPPVRDNRPVATLGTAVIRGRVIAADTGQPLRRAQVRATASSMRDGQIATTDGNGVYELKDLPAGRYQLAATKGTYVRLEYGQTHAFEAGKPLEVADGQTIDRVDFRLPPGGLITGRILDEYGEPVPQVNVSAKRYQFQGGKRQLVPSGQSSATNDLGEFRIYALPPGDYVVSATVFSLDFGAVSNDRAAYAPTYYPGTVVAADAQRLTLDIGQARAGIDIALAAVRLARITGTAVDSNGKTVTGGMVMLMPSGGIFDGLPVMGQFRADGTFVVSDVAPGTYDIAAMPIGDNDDGDAIDASITVAGDDISGLRLVGVKPVSVSGHVRLPLSMGQANRPSPLQLTFMAGGASPMPRGLARVKDDLTFEATVAPGLQFIRPFSFPTPATGLVLKAVRMDGVDVTDSGLDVRAGQDLSGIEVEFAAQLGTLAGRVTDARGEPVKDYSTIVFARDSAKWTASSRYFGSSRPDQDGRYSVANLPAGEYYAVALDFLETGTDKDPDFLEKIRDRATPFTIGDTESKTLDLQIVSN